MEKKQEKKKRLHEGISVSEERSHGTLPLAWEKAI